MNQNHIIAYDYLSQAQQALKAGDRKIAQEYCDLAKQVAPDLEEVWLLQASLAAPQESITFLEKALAINPGSERAKRGMLWAQNRLKHDQALEPAISAAMSNEPIEDIPGEATAPAAVFTSTVEEDHTPQEDGEAATEPIEEIPATAQTSPRMQKVAGFNSRTWITLASVAVVVGLILAGWFYRDLISGTINILLNGGNADAPWSDADLPELASATPISATQTQSKPSAPLVVATQTKVPTALPSLTSSATSVPTQEPTATTQPSATPVLVTVTPDPIFAGQPSPTPLPTDTAEPTFEPYATPTVTVYDQDLPADVVTSFGERWIDVNLSQQMVYAYEGDTLVNSFLTSTGTWEHPTVTGQYNVYVKYSYTDMSGADYYLANVPNTMYFYDGYAIHGTYWHNNFGTPMSHGCVNLSIPDSAWVFQWASVGTLVNVHY